ncbi:non-ribosomal peptide synthetase [Gordonia sp. SID5947]|uniref:non-ribosomal peptide synthetase n=1 Tax=Gordonia sp. SID5947 TaxID=2690315 RepID=UPI001F44A1B3|nr:non-ribosomal peptide synthetase [Gordonia sp. SID5947]
MRSAVDGLVAHHRVLRSGFVQTEGGAVVAVIPDEVRVPWRTVDLGAVDDAERQARVREITDRERVEPFDLSAPPLLRVVFARDTDGVSVVITNHHILFDGWSGPLVLADLLALYASGSTYTGQIGTGGGDFEDHLKHVAAVDDAAGLAAWRAVLAPVEGPSLVAPGSVATRESLPRNHVVVVDAQLTAAVEALARAQGATVATVLQFAWAVLVARLTGNRVVTFGETVSGRPADLEGVEAMVGLFINTLPAVVDVDPSARISEVLGRLQAAKVSVLDHQHLGLPELMALTETPGSFDTLTVHESYPVDTESLSTGDAALTGGLDIREAVVSDSTHYPLNMITSPMGDRLSITVKYLPDAFADEQIRVFADALLEILRAAAAAPETLVADVPLLTAQERVLIADRSVGADVRVPPGSVADAVAAQVLRTPDATALVFGDRALTYAEFGARVSTLARELIEAGVSPGVAVGISIDRSVELVVGVHAVVAAGGHYVPIDPAIPTDRVQYMVATARVGVVLVAGDAVPPSVGALGDHVAVHAVDCSGPADLSVAPVSDAERPAPLRADDAAYTLFTSGSTGRPKGVTVSHRSVVNRLWWGLDRYPWSAGDRVVLKTPFTFDVSVPELFAPVMAGATIVVARPGGHADPTYIADLIAREGVTSVHFVPSMLSVFLDVVPAEKIRALGTLRWLFCSGEALPPPVVAHAHRLLGRVSIVNLFGPTEAAVEVAYADVTGAPDVVPIGVPVWNTSTLVLDARMRLVPPGVPGELYLGGVQVARGYESRAGLTAERFVADPFGAPGSRLYRTGDLVRWSDRGEIEYLGRTDFQVKLRGQRIELGEIESVIASAPGVVHAACTVVGTDGGAQHLVAYVAPSTVDETAVRAAVAEALPEYMRPSMWMLLDDIALNSAGKLDRRALPDPVFEAADHVAPATDAEASVAAIVANVLGVEQVSVTESFFTVGGNSLSAMRVAARVADEFGAAVSVRDIFDAPTVRDLAAAVSSRGAGLAPLVALSPRPVPIPLSFAQTRMWFINRYEPGTATYNIPVVLRLSGALDVAALRAAVVDTIGRHEVLRTTFPSVDGMPVQVIDSAAHVAERLDWAVVDAPSDVETAMTTGFDVTTEWPVRVRLLAVSDDEYLLAVIAHHIAADGESMLPLVTDLVTAYLARAQGLEPQFAPLAVQFADYAIWQHSVLGSPDAPDSVVGRQLSFWKDQLVDAPDVLQLPADRERPAVASHRGARVHFALPAEVGRQIGVVASAFGVTPFMVVHAGLAVLLARLSATDDITIATPIAGRGQASLDPLVGMFVNTLVLRTRVDTATTFAELLDDVRVTDLDAFAHADVPFETVVEALNPSRSEAFAPLAQVMLSFDPAAAAESTDQSVGGLSVQSIEPAWVPAQLDLSVTVNSAAAEEDWPCSIVYATDLFDHSSVERMADRFVSVLADLVASPAVAVGDVAVISAQERAVVDGWSVGPVVDVPDDLVPEIVAAQAVRTPDAAALVFGDRTVTYSEFAARIAVLARRLIAAGAAPGVAVGVSLDRSVEMVVAVHAVLAAGAQYVPIDPDTPNDRVEYMIDTAHVRIVLVGAGRAAVAEGVRTIEVDTSGVVDRSVPAVTDKDRPAPLRSDDAAYTLFTSGSTGRPKGVTVSHRALLNRMRWCLEVFDWNADERVMLKTPYTFDVSVPELFAPVMTGATMIVARAGGHLEPVYIADLIARQGVTSVHFVPSMLSVFLDVVPADTLSALDRVRWLLTSGEALPLAVATHAHEALPRTKIVNLYGPTEATVDVTAVDVTGAEHVTIGRPEWNTSTYVLDARLRPVPQGVPGELYLGGVQLARGYASRPALTAERFVADPFGAPGSRLYRTGDLVRWSDRGEIEYLGRTDFQVKLRGQRIELGEIESVIASAPGVVHAACAVVDAPTGGQHLVAYLAPASIEQSAVKAVVADALPEYMRPSVWMLLDDIELNSSGKLNRKALPAPVFEAGEYIAPATDAEATVATVFADVLGVDRVSVTESFFGLGGNSLSAMRVAARVADDLGVDVSVRDLFEAPSVRELIEAVAGRGQTVAPLVAGRRPDRLPLSLAQSRMWFINRFDPASSAYNIPMALRLTGALDLGELVGALGDVIERHEVLRTVYPTDGDGPIQHILTADRARALFDWRVADDQHEVAVSATEGFDVTVDLPIRGRVWRSGDNTHDVVLTVHHIAFDGSSTAVFVRDLLTAYMARVGGDVPGVPPLAVQYGDYALWQRKMLGDVDDPSSRLARQLGYWRDHLRALPSVTDLPMDRPRPAVMATTAGVVSMTVDDDLARRVEEFARSEGVTPFMATHVALAILVARLASTDDVVIGTPIAGRTDAALADLVGMFVNTLVLRTAVQPAQSVSDLVAQVRQVDLDAFAHADVQFEELIDELAPTRSTAFPPLAQIAFTHVDDDPGTAALETAGLVAEPLELADQVAKFELSVAVTGRTASSPMTVDFVYARSLFDESTVRGFVMSWLRVVESMVDDPDVAVGDIDLITPSDVAMLAPVSGGPPSPPRLLSAMFADVVDRHGDRVAVVDATGAELTYAALDARSNQLARWLVSQGVGVESLVALAIGRSVELLTAIWAVAKTGAGHLPIDPAYPADRIEHMLSDSGVRVGLTVERHRSEMGTVVGWTTLDSPEVRPVIDGMSPDALAPSELIGTPHVDAVAYVIYTSGSTGTPKGVALTARTLENFALTEVDRFAVTDRSRVLGFASPSFDASVLEWLMAVGAGAALVYRPEDALGGEPLAAFMRGQRVTHTFLTPTVLATLKPEDLPDLQVLAAGGEAVPPAMVERWGSHVRFHDMYGPTETTIVVAMSDAMRPGVPTTLGGPIPGVGLLVLDSRLRVVPVGVAGELYVAGGALARGYIGRPGLTSQRFVAHPFGTDGERLYRTGDVVRWRRDDSGGLALDYLGRSDDQVKLRGLRVELGEIEAALASHPSVESAVVIGVGGSVATALAGYVVLRDDVDTGALRTFVGSRLPSHMVPSSLTVLDALPLTPVGKLDKRALPEPVVDVDREFVAAANAAEQSVAQVFAEVLGVAQVSVTESFFELGGNSLSATRVAARVSEVSGAEVSVRDVFEAPSVRELARGLDGRGLGLAPVVAVTPRPGRVPLSFAQSRMWFINQFDPSASTYNVPVVLRLVGALDVAALRSALVDVVTRHEVLRTTFPAVDGSPIQEIAAADGIADRLDWSVVDSAASLEAAVTEGFDVTVQWPLRARLWHVDHDEWVFALVAHHIAADGESMAPLVGDVVTAYAARSAGAVPEFAPLDVQFADFAIWQHEVLGSAGDTESVVAQQLSYWSQQLAGLPDVLELPSDRPRPVVASQRGDQVPFRVPADVVERIGSVAREFGVTPFMVVHAGLSVLLARLSATGDIAVGTPVAGRGRRELDALVGMFVNTLVLRAQIDPTMSFAEVIDQVRVTDLDAFGHADVPFEALVDHLDPVRSEAFAPLTQILLTFHQASLPELAAGVGATAVAGLSISPLEAPETPAKVDLTFGIAADSPDEAWPAQIVYATDLFDRSTIETMADRFVRVLAECVESVDRPVGDVTLLSATEAAQIAAMPAPVLETVNTGLSLVDLFRSTVDEHGGRQAVTAGGVTLSYEALQTRSDAVAAALAMRGIGVGDLVGVATARTVDLVAAIVGVLKVGAAYLPLDTTNPADRLAFIVSDAAVDTVITDAATAGHELFTVLPAGVTTVHVADLAAEGAARPVPPPVMIPPSSRAYVIYTSGSTGVPKGVEVTHRDVVTLMDTAAGDFEFLPTDVWTMFHSYAFDFSVWELWGPFLSGARLVIVDRNLARDPDAFVELLAAEGVTILSQTPSAFYQLVDARRRNSVDLPLRYVVFGGEALSFDQVRRWFDDHPGDSPRLVNMYGITETTVHVSFRPLDRALVAAGDASLIGRPLYSLAIHILDDRLHPVPPGVVGEMYVTGGQLAQGYLGRPGLSSTRFVASPFADGARMYRTGDLARRVGDDIEYLGRGDAQVQLRGFRIEYGEIEAALLGVEGVAAAAASVVDLPGRGEQLIGYVVAESGVEPESQSVRDIVARAVPGYMVPALIVPVTHLPLTANGKLDRRALPMPEIEGGAEDHVAPESSVEETLAQVVAGVLGVDRVSVVESFFSLGGDSILAIQVSSGARAAGLVVSPRDVFEHKSVRAMARAVAAGGADMALLAEPSGGGREMVIPPVASWMLELSDSADDFADFSQSVVLVAPDGLDAATLREVLQTVVAAHPVMSGRLFLDEGRWIGTSGDGRGCVVGATTTDARTTSAEFGHELHAAHAVALGELNPAVGQLVSAMLVTGADGARVVLAIHHLAVDAVSWPILIEDVVTVWGQLQAGQEPAVRAEVTSARAWHAALEAQAADREDEVDHWLVRVDRAPTSFGAPLDRVRDRFDSVATQRVRIDPKVTEALLTTVPEAFGGHVNDALVAALARAVRSWQQSHAIADDSPVSVLMEGHGRYEEVVERGSDPRTADLSRTVGWFTAISPMSVDPADGIVHAVKAAKEERLGHPDRGIGFGLLRFGGDRRLAGCPLPSIGFNFFGAGTRGTREEIELPFMVDSDAPSLPASVSGAMTAMNVLTVNVGTRQVSMPHSPGVVDGDRELVADFLFVQGILSADDAADLARRWSDELAAVVATLAEADPGLSPSDVPGTGVTQADLDALAQRYPGADVWPLAPLQRGLHFESEIAGHHGAGSSVDVYVVQSILELGGEIDVARLRGAAEALFAHHRALRSGFVRTGSGAVVAVVPETVELPWQVVDVDEVAPDGPADDVIRRIADTQRSVPFDLEAPPLMRFALIRHGDTAHLVVTNHHILIDGWSGPLVLADLLALYAGGVTYTGQIGRGDRDFADHLRRLADVDRAAGLAAWREVLAPLEGPTLVAPGVEATPESLPQDRSTILDAELTAGIEAVGRAEGATVATVLQFAWAVLLSRLTGNQVVTFAETVSGRPADLEGVESMVGLFINTLPAVVDVDPAAPISEVLGRLQAAKVSVLDHQHLVLPELTASADVDGALFDTLTVHESYPVDTDSLSTTDAALTGGLEIKDFEGTDATHYPLNMSTSPVAGERISLTLKYLPAAFDERQIQVFIDALVQILRAVATRPDMLTADIPLIGPVDGRALAHVSGGAGTEPRLLVEMFGDAAARYPDRIAVVDGHGASLTYAQLDSRSNRLARWLISRGIGVESLVALAIGRSVELLTAIWAVAKTGAGYVPIDPGYPAERVATMVEDSGAILGLTTATGDLPDQGFAWVRLDNEAVGAEIGGFGDGPLRSDETLGRVRPENVAYVIYTSGSTGRPKGVSVTHTGLANFAAQESTRLAVGHAPVVLGFASPSFDASVLEYLLATVTGGTLAYRPADAVGGPALQDFMNQHRTTHTFLTPTVLSTLDPAGLPHLEGLMAGGEAVPPSMVEAWAPHVPIHNLYGPTETTIGITLSSAMEAGRPVRLGRPLAGVELLVLDGRLHPVPVGVPGELYAVGGALSRGYLDRPGLSAQRFVANPYGGAGERMYRTGDVVRWRRDEAGELVLEYAGRSDDQVKLRGLRIELGEIEAVLASHPAVESAVVLGVGGSVATALAGYVVADSAVDVQMLREFVGARLPSHMVPAGIAVLDSLPLTPVGKLDKRALPEPVLGTDAEEYVEPATDEERMVSQVFAEVLGVDGVGALHSFFDLGGNSLSATRVIAQLRERGADVELAWLFNDPTPRGLAARIGGGSGAGGDVVIALNAQGSRPPLFCIHPAGGLAWFYGGFVPYLQDRPVYGVQDPHAVSGEPSAESIEEMADRYLAEIRRISPEGPYHLLGWSLGGYVAYAMATALQAERQEVAFLGVMDSSPVPESAEESVGVQLGGDFVGDFLGGWRDLFDLGEDVHAESAEDVAEIIRQQISSMGLLRADQVQWVMDSFATGEALVEQFRPAPFDGSLLVFTATRDKEDPSAVARGWEPHVNGSITNVDVDADHLGLANASALEVIGPELNQWLTIDGGHTQVTGESGKDRP